MPTTWDDPATVRYYEAFCEAHGRYREANQALIGAASLQSGQSVLDLAAGTGRTAQAALDFVDNVTCVEPAEAMRAEGRRRLPQISWLAHWPEPDEQFDRVVCGAAIWQMMPLEQTFARVAALLKPGGAFAFNIPSLYVGQADAPGGGSDPHLFELVAQLADGRTPAAASTETLPGADDIERQLQQIGFSPLRWCARSRLTQDALRDWMKIPVLTDALLDGIEPDLRAQLVDAAYARCDAASWRWEAWIGWTAWKS
jgi:ubiquinone/menaquinone biosynthesis C-methylase UbiE